MLNGPSALRGIIKAFEGVNTYNEPFSVIPDRGELSNSGLLTFHVIKRHNFHNRGKYLMVGHNQSLLGPFLGFHVMGVKSCQSKISGFGILFYATAYCIALGKCFLYLLFSSTTLWQDAKSITINSLTVIFISSTIHFGRK